VVEWEGGLGISLPSRFIDSRYWLSDATPIPFACRICETSDRKIQIARAGAGGGAIDDASAPELIDLSPREREIADLLSLGHTNSEISAILHLSIRTVEHHRSRVFRKMNVRSRAGLVQALRDRRADLG